MASEGGKIKSRRRQAPSKPYDRNLTLFGKLRRSVKDLLIPSWLSSSHQQSERQATGDACQAVQAPSLSPVENDLSTGAQLQNRAGDGFDQTQSLVQLGRDQEEQYSSGIEGEAYMDVRHGDRVPSLTLVRQDEQLVSRKQDTPSTSRVSGGLRQEPQQTRIDHLRLRMSDSYLNDADQNIETTGVHPIMTSTRVLNQSSDVLQPVAKRQRLWSPESDKQGKYLASPLKEKPAFNSVLLGSLSDSSMFGGDSLHTSLFYPGKTRFGGASAERQISLNTSLPYQSSLPLRKQVRPHNVSNNISATTSATAQRILETLDRMSTPLGDARKIPVASESANDSVLSFTPSSYRHTSFQSGRPVTRPLQLTARGPPTSQHQALAQAVIAKNRQRSGVVDRRQNYSALDDEVEEDDRTMDMAISQESSGLVKMIKPSVSDENRVSLGQQAGMLGKMKVKRFSQHISSAGTDGNKVVEMPNLHTDFTLPISNMGPISLQSQPVKSQTVAAASIPSADESVPIKFIFSAPIDENKHANSQISDTTDKNFRFTSPIKTSQTKTSAAGAEGEAKNCQEPAVGASSGMPLWPSSSSFTPSVTAWGSTAPKPKLASPDIGGTSSSFKSYSKWGGFDKPDDSSAASDTSGGFSLAPAASLKTGSVMDILGGGKSLSSAPTPFTSSAGITHAAKETSVPGSDDLMAKFKKPVGAWECSSCMIVNKPEAARCVCCETVKPGARPTQPFSGLTTVPPSSTTTIAASVPHTDSVITNFRTSPATSESDTSKLSNKPEAGKPVATEAARPGAKQPQNGTGNSLSALFKKPPGAWECDTCMVQNVAGADRCIACDSSKPGLQAAGIVSKASVSSGGPSAITISPAGGFTFNVSATTTTTSGSGGFKFGSASTSSTASSSSSASLPASTGFTFGQTTTANKDKKDLSNSSSTGSTASTPLAGGFKFGASSLEGGSGSAVSGSSGFGVANSGSGFVFGSISSGTSSIKTGTSVSSFQTGETVKVSTSDVPERPSDSSVVTAPSSQLDVRSNGIPSIIDFNKTNSFVSTGATGFQFGGALSTKSTAASGILQFGTGMESKDSSTKVSHQQVSFNFAPSSTAPATLMTSQKSDCLASKPANTLFQFGASSAVPAPSIGLGMGNSLSDGKPMVNGGFGSAFGVQTIKGDSKAASLDSSKSFGNFTFGSTTTPSVFGGFGQSQAAASEPVSGPVISQVSQSSKRTGEIVETDHLYVKKPFNSGISEPSSNGLFPFGGSVPFNTTPNFNFGATSQQQTSVFQFGAKPVENSTSAPGLFAFGAAHPSSASTEGSGFGTPAGMGPAGGFSIGAGESGRKVKKAVRRIKK